MAGRATLGRRRTEPRLDPIGWRPPGRGAFLRLAAVAALLATAAAISWSGPKTCAPAPTAATSAPAKAQATPGSDVATKRGAAAVPPGSVGVPIRLAEPTALTLVHPGDRIDLLSVEQGGATVAAAALVLGVTGAGDPSSGGLLVALAPTDAKKALAPPGQGFAILIRPD